MQDDASRLMDMATTVREAALEVVRRFRSVAIAAGAPVPEEGPPDSGFIIMKIQALQAERDELARRLEAEQRAHAETADELARVKASLQRQVER